MRKYDELIVIFQNLQAIIGFIGIVGNIINIVVFSRKSFQKYSYSFYHQAMSFNDILLLAHTFRYWLALVLNLEVNSSSVVTCLINDYHLYVAISVSLWLRTIILIDQINSIVYLNRFKLLRKQWFQVTLVALVVLLSFILHLTFAFNPRFEATKIATLKSCRLPDEILRKKIWIVLVNIVSNMVLNVFLSMKLVSFIYLSRKNVLIKFHLHQSHLNAVRDRNFAISAIGLNLVGFLSKLPFALSIELSNFFSLSSEQFQLVFTTTLTLAICKNAATFFTNIILNSVFFEEFLNMFRRGRSSEKSSSPVYV